MLIYQLTNTYPSYLLRRLAAFLSLTEEDDYDDETEEIELVFLNDTRSDDYFQLRLLFTFYIDGYFFRLES